MIEIKKVRLEWNKNFQDRKLVLKTDSKMKRKYILLLEMPLPFFARQNTLGLYFAT